MLRIPLIHSIIANWWILCGPLALFKKGRWSEGPLRLLSFECFGLESECDAIDVDQPFELIEVFLSTNDEVLVVPARCSTLFVSNSCNFSIFSKLLLSAVGDELRGWRRVHQQTVANVESIIQALSSTPRNRNSRVHDEPFRCCRKAR